MVMYREVCPEGVQNKCPGGVWCRGFMSWGDTLILVISRGVQLYYGIAQFWVGPTPQNFEMFGSPIATSQTIDAPLECAIHKAHDV